MVKRINILVDWGESFVDQNGSFYCGTTEAQKDKAVSVVNTADLVVYLSDLHTRTSSEFVVNGGLYPPHNLRKKDWSELETLGLENNKSVSPQLTAKLENLVRRRRSGLMVPRHVFFQDYNGEPNPQPAFMLEDVEETFGIRRLDEQEFCNERIDYIVNVKHMFNGTGLQATEFLGLFKGIPDIEKNIFTLLKEQYGQGKELVFDVTGVVMGICIYQTASGIKQIFPKAEINIIADACTHLIYAPLGIADEDTGNLVAKKMCQQIGINYLTTAEYLK